MSMQADSGFSNVDIDRLLSNVVFIHEVTFVLAVVLTVCVSLCSIEN